ncbi:MAG: choice-of-anchor J domain-containing protein [Bacteroidales bacterium]|nr:choice-of-anchor J domain-containing protein [Bacteroidales bacterium]
MKKFYVIICLLLVASIGFSQYASKQDAKSGIHSKNKTLVKPTVNPIQKATRAVIFEDGFETGDLAGWTLVDADGDGYNWSAITGEGSTTPHSGVYNVTSASWNGTDLHPENWLISPAIDLSTVTGTIMVNYWVRAQDQGWPAEHYKLVVSTTNVNVASFTDNVYEETLTSGPVADDHYLERDVNLSVYAGEIIYLAWVHYDCSGLFRINLDDISVYTNEVIDAAVIGITEPNHDNGCTLTSDESITIKIKNNGGADMTDFDVSYTINGGTPVVETVSSTIIPAAILNYTFTQTVDLSALDNYTIEASVTLTGDANANNDTYSIDIVSGDKVITIHAFTDDGGKQSWQVINTLTSEVVAERTAPWQWNIEVTETICVIDANCYTVIVSDEGGDGMVDGAAYLEILYDGVQVAGSTTPDSWSTATLVAENLGSGCAAIDAKIESIEPIYSSCELGMVDIIVNVKNAGSTDISAFDLAYTINSGTPVSESLTETILAGEIYQHTFATQADLSADGTYTIEATVTLVGDEISTNNSADIVVINIESSEIPYTNAFEVPEIDLMGWAIENTNADDSYWTTATGYGTDGSNCIAYPYASTAADDWIFSICLDLVGGQEYTVKIDYAVMSESYPEKLDVYYGEAQASTSMTLIADVGTFTNTEYMTGAYNFTPTTAGTYYIGLHAYSDAEMYYLFVDNFSVDFSTSSIEMNSSNISVFPNPANNVITVANAENENIVVLNMLGEVVANISNASSNQTIDISNLANGTYFVRVNAEVFKINVVK